MLLLMMFIKIQDLDFVEYVSLDELLERSDLISLHCPLMDNTYHLINKETIAKNERWSGTCQHIKRWSCQDR